MSPDEWVERYGDYLYRFAVSRLNDVSAAEEVVQEAFLAGIRFQHQFEGKGSQRSWLLGILRRKIIDQFRQRARRERFQALQEEYDPTFLLFDDQGRWKPGRLPHLTAEPQIESQELWQIVKSCLSQIPQGQADVFVLRVMEQMEAEQICQQLDISLSNLWVRLHRARLGLAKCVSSKWFIDERGSETA